MKLDMEKYKAIRIAQGKGARTIEDIRKMTDIAIESEDEEKAIEEVLSNVCRCNNTPLSEVVNAVKNGADTVEKVMEITKAGTVCGRCKGIIENIINNKK